MTFTRPTRAPDWADTVSGPLRHPQSSARAAFEETLTNPPAWLGAAMRVRNAVVRPFGLTTEAGGEGGADFLSRMPILRDTPRVFETGLPDKHLTFTVTLVLSDTHASATTAIWYNHPLGRLYLALVTPGHILAVRSMVGRIAHPVTRVRGAPEGLTP